jgi:hypothetical protein
MAAHSLYWDLYTSGFFDAVHFQPDSVADYDLIFHFSTFRKKHKLYLRLRWRGQIDGEADDRIAKVKEMSFEDQLCVDPEESYDDLCDAIKSVNRKAVSALKKWLRGQEARGLAVKRARHDINYFHYFDEQFAELDGILHAAASPPAEAYAQEEVNKRKLVLEFARAKEREMCAGGSLAKRAMVFEQLRAKEPLDREMVAYNKAISRQKRRQRFAEFMGMTSIVLGGVSSGLSQAAYLRTRNPYYAQQAHQVQQQAMENARRLFEQAQRHRAQAQRLTFQRNQFASAVVPELASTFEESPYAQFLEAFFEQVDFSSVQRMRVTTREAYLRTFASYDELLQTVEGLNE